MKILRWTQPCCEVLFMPTECFTVCEWMVFLVNLFLPVLLENLTWPTNSWRTHNTRKSAPQIKFVLLRLFKADQGYFMFSQLTESDLLIFKLTPFLNSGSSCCPRTSVWVIKEFSCFLLLRAQSKLWSHRNERSIWLPLWLLDICTFNAWLPLAFPEFSLNNPHSFLSITWGCTDNKKNLKHTYQT